MWFNAQVYNVSVPKIVTLTSDLLTYCVTVATLTNAFIQIYRKVSKILNISPKKYILLKNI